MLLLLSRLKRCLAAVTAAVAFAAAVGPVVAAHYDIVLLGGQSNADGRASAGSLTGPLATPLPDVRFYYGATDRFPQRVLPRDTWQALAPGAGTDFGPDVSFGHAIDAALPDRSLAIIKHARGGTNLFEDWAPGGPDHTAFNSTVADALAALTAEGHTFRITAMLWVQGESDMVRGRTGAQYEADLTTFVGDMRSRYGHDLPFFVAQASDGQTRLGTSGIATLQAAQETATAADDRAYLVSTNGFGMQDDYLHYDAPGQVQLGEAFATAYAAVVPEPTTLTSLGLLVMLIPRRRQRSCSRSRPHRRVGQTYGGKP
ncbi:MAG: sialate O-acetylesterase [Planctomycetota bacterium]